MICAFALIRKRGTLAASLGSHQRRTPKILQQKVLSGPLNRSPWFMHLYMSWFIRNKHVSLKHHQLYCGIHKGLALIMNGAICVRLYFEHPSSIIRFFYGYAMHEQQGNAAI